MLIRHLLEYKRAIDKKIVETHVAGLSLDAVAVLHTIEQAVLDIDVVDIACRVESDNLYTVF